MKDSNLDTCNCCQGTQTITPEPIANRPGLNALRYRIGTHATFLETMKARLSSHVLPPENGQLTRHPLRELTTRAADDAAIALLDAWATVADVLTFYQERIANEGFLRTATERRSILELARLVGYRPRPGVAASVYLAFTIQEKMTDPVEIPANARVQSVPGPGEDAQTFEISEVLEARAEWNNLKPRRTQPQNITLANALVINRIYFQGTTTNLKQADRLLLVFGREMGMQIVRSIKEVQLVFAENRTEAETKDRTLVILEDLPRVAQIAGAHAITLLPTLQREIEADPLLPIAEQIFGDHLSEAQRVAYWFQSILVGNFPKALLDYFIAPNDDTFRVLDFNNTDLIQVMQGLSQQISEELKNAQETDPPVETLTDINQLVKKLILRRSLQPENRTKLLRNSQKSLTPRSELMLQLFVQAQPRIGQTLYSAVQNAQVTSSRSDLKSISVFRVKAMPFGHAAPAITQYIEIPPEQGHNETTRTVQYAEWNINEPFNTKSSPSPIHTENIVSIDGEHDISDKSWVLFEHFESLDHVKSLAPRTVLGLVTQNGVKHSSVAGYGMSGKVTQLLIDPQGTSWNLDSFESVRNTTVYAAPEKLTLAEEPITANIGRCEDDSDNWIELDGVYSGLKSGRWAIVSGERVIEGTRGVYDSELVMLDQVEQYFDANLPGDKTHTRVTFATPLAYCYKRDTAIIYGNVAHATHGETLREVLGGGNAAEGYQQFKLKQPPLTFVAAPTAEGADSTLKVYVNDVAWQAAETFTGLYKTDQRYVLKIEDNGETSVVFGNGAQGARLPSGLENIRTEYRKGIGKAGNVRGKQISLLLTRPMGVQDVINPLPATGGADRESRDSARRNVPTTVTSLGRLVSLQDYEDFARTFAGIGKAHAVQFSDGTREIVHLTIAGADDIPIDETSDLYRNLVRALRENGDPDQAVHIDLRELMFIVVSANVRIEPNRVWERVVKQIRVRLYQEFSYENQHLGEGVPSGQILRVIQTTPGVEYVDLDAFGGIPEKENDVERTERAPLAPETISARVTQLMAKPFLPLRVNFAHRENRIIVPAQLAYLTSAVPDTLILNQIN